MSTSIDIAKVRDDFPALKNFVWLQNGGVSITPLPVAREHATRMEELLERGPLHIAFPQEEYPRRARSMDVLAHFFSCQVSELALMRGVSEAFQTVLRGIDWHAGDRVLITEDEEAALLLPLLHLRDVSGIEVIKVSLVADPHEQLALFERQMNERTRLLAVSHVTTDRGFRLPVERLCEAARARGVLSFVDLAHSAGLFPLSLRDLGCDFAGLLSYKWMYAPYAAGALFVRREMLDVLQVRYAGGRSQAALDFEGDTYSLRDSAERFQYGPWSWPLVHAWARSLEYLQSIGLAAIEERTQQLATHLKEGLAELGAELYTPTSAESSAALVSFGYGEVAGKDLCAALRQRWNIVVKALPHGRQGLRASVAFFLLDDELDVLLSGLHALGKERRSK